MYFIFNQSTQYFIILSSALLIPFMSTKNLKKNNYEYYIEFEY